MAKVKVPKLPTLPKGGGPYWEVTIFVRGQEDAIYGHAVEGNVLITEKFIQVKWVDGGFTYLPMDSINYMHYSPITIH